MRALGLLALLASGCTHLVWYGHSADRRHVVAVIEAHGSQRVRFDTVDGPLVKGVALEGLVLGADGHLAYAAQLESGRWVVFHDGAPGPEFDGLGAVRLSADGRHVAYAAQREGGWHVVHDGLVGERFEALFPGALSFGATGRLAYAGQRGGQSFVVVDGRSSEGWDAVGALRWSRDGRSVSFLARRGAAAFAVVDGVPRGPFAGVTAHHFGPPEVLVVDDGGWRVQVGGVASDVVSAVGAVHVEAGRVAWLARREGRTWVMDGAAAHGPFDAAQPALARDATGALVFAAKQADGWYVARGTSRWGPWVKVEDVSVRGAHVGFVGVRVERDVVVHDGRELASWDWAGSLALSPDGARVAYLARRGSASRLVVDGVEHPVDLAVEGTVAFSSDGRRVGCVTGDRAKRRLRFTFDDGTSRPLDFEELVAASALAPRDALPSADADLLRRWVAAELERP